MQPDYDEQYRALKADYLQIVEDDFRESDRRGSLRLGLASIVQSYVDELGMAAFIGLRISGLEDHLSRIERRADRKRRLVARAMARAGIETITEPEFTVIGSRTQGALVVNDESAIPASFWKEGPRELDHDALLAVLRDGATVPGASLGESEATISVRTR
jgi:hypothetical protein